MLRSWAVPKGPSLDLRVRRLAVPVADHSLSAGEFEGVHAGASRGSGAVIIWDEGSAEIVRDEADHLSFVPHGHKLTGRFALTRTGADSWILVKGATSTRATAPTSSPSSRRACAAAEPGRRWPMAELRERAVTG